jgi:UDP-hydrolysing UDP-N-acetyl-D-glucosamine 2-epimerase
MNNVIAIGIGSRANYSSIKSFCSAISRHEIFQLKIFLYASAATRHYGDLKTEIESDGYTVDLIMDNLIYGDSGYVMAKTTGLALVDVSNYLDRLRPNYVVTVGDRFETMAVAVASSYMGIPLIHTMGGEITGTLDESVRHSITKLANVHFVSNQKAFDVVRKLGEDPRTIFNVGCPRIDVIRSAINKREKKYDISDFGEGESIDIYQDEFVMISQHAVTTEYMTLESDYLCTLQAVYKTNKKAIFFWPNSDAGHEKISKITRAFRQDFHPPWRFVRNLPNELYANLLNNTQALVGNSSSGIRDSNYLGTPVVNIGTRQNRREFGANVVHAGYNTIDIMKKLKFQLDHGRYNAGTLYGDGRAGEKMVNILSKIQFCNTQKVICYK